MAILQVKNNARSTLASGIGSTDTSLTVATGEGSKFPSTTPFRISIDNEIIEVGAVSSDTFSSLTRGVEGTTAAAHSAGAIVELRITADIINQLQTNKGVATVYTSITSLTPNAATDKEIYINALAGALTINNPTGTPNDGQKLIIRIKDNGTARTISWGTAYQSASVTLPTTTVVGQTTYVSLRYNSNTSKWECIAANANWIPSPTGAAQGDILYYDGSQWNRLPAGTAGYFLKTQGAGANPVWSLPAAITSYSETINLGSQNSNVYSTGFSISISSGQKVFIIFAGYTDQAVNSSQNDDYVAAIQMDGSDVIYSETNNLSRASTSAAMKIPMSVCTLQSPSAGNHTIRMRFFCSNSSFTFYLKGSLVALVF